MLLFQVSYLRKFVVDESVDERRFSDVRHSDDQDIGIGFRRSVITVRLLDEFEGARQDGLQPLALDVLAVGEDDVGQGRVLVQDQFLETIL